jgi:hypothetical protein
MYSLAGTNIWLYISVVGSLYNLLTLKYLIWEDSSKSYHFITAPPIKTQKLIRKGAVSSEKATPTVSL